MENEHSRNDSMFYYDAIVCMYFTRTGSGYSIVYDMSIEIIEKPTHKCEACRCVFAFNQDDFQEMSFRVGTKEPSCGHRVETWNKQTYVACPICGLAHVIKEKKETKEKWY